MSSGLPAEYVLESKQIAAAREAATRNGILRAARTLNEITKAHDSRSSLARRSGRAFRQARGATPTSRSRTAPALRHYRLNANRWRT